MAPPLRALAAAAALLALLPAASAATKCRVALKWAPTALAYARVRFKIQGYPMLTMRSQDKGSVSGDVVVTMPAVNGACDFGSTLDPTDPALANAVAAATLSTPEPLKVSNVTGKFGRLTTWYYFNYTVHDLRVNISSGAVGAKINKRAPINDMGFKVKEGNSSVFYQTKWRGNLETGTLELDLTQSGVVATGCTLTAKKATAEWFLNCNALKAVFDAITAESWDMNIFITVRGTGLTASGAFASAVPVP